MSYEIYLGVDGYWWWRLYGAGGRVIAHGTQGHASTKACRQEIEAVKASGSAQIAEVTAPAPGGQAEPF